MIRITVEMWPKGSEAHKRTIATAEIVNTGQGSDSRGEYRFQFNSVRSVVADGVVQDFPRNSKGVWYLIKRCLEQMK